MYKFPSPCPGPCDSFPDVLGAWDGLSPPRICCDSVGSTFSHAFSCPSLPGSCFPLSEGGVCYQSFCRGLQGFFGQIRWPPYGSSLGWQHFFLLFRLSEFSSFSLHLSNLLCESWRRLFWIEILGWLISFLNLDAQIFPQVWKFTACLSFFFIIIYFWLC